jgi:integrase
VITRTRYQNGCLYRERRKAGPDAWVFRYRDGQAHRKVNIGSTEILSKRDAQKAIEELRVKINREVRTPQTIAELVAHYRDKELRDDGRNCKSYSTRKAYECYLKNWILPKWAEYSLSDVRTIAVEEWLDGIPRANGTRAKLRNLMSALFNHADRYEWINKNPIRRVRQSAKRERVPDVLTEEEVKALLSELDGAYYVMTLLAITTGLRVSELLALRWQDCDFAVEEIHVTRAIVCQHVGPLKTETSGKPVPMDAGLPAVLLDWRRDCPYNQDNDYVFGSPEKHGKQPLWPSSAMSKHIRPAAIRAGIKKHVRWHVFRHSAATIMKKNGEDVKTVQEFLRHADSKMTLDTYTQGSMSAKRAAQRRIFEAVVPSCSHAIVAATASA